MSVFICIYNIFSGEILGWSMCKQKRGNLAVFRVYFPPTSPPLKNMWIFMFNVILCAVESSVIHRQHSVLRHCRAGLHQMPEDRSFSGGQHSWRAGLHWRMQ